MAHIVFNSNSAIPTVGASGAISGILGGYLLMFPRNRVLRVDVWGVATVPAIFMLGLWIVTQLLNGVGEIARTDDTGGVAYLAHIGGFVAGLVLAPILRRGHAPRRALEAVLEMGVKVWRGAAASLTVVIFRSV